MILLHLSIGKNVRIGIDFYKIKIKLLAFIQIDIKIFPKDDIYYPQSVKKEFIIKKHP
jgi:hypothetical protein